MKLKKIEIALMIGLAVVIFCGAGLHNEQSQLAEKLIRFHVVANSDSDEDQALKLKVRDAVLLYAEELTKGADSAGLVQEILSEHLDDIKQVAEEKIQEEGYEYSARVSLGTEAFPTREYDSFTLPAGRYTALRVVIGSGAGKNWWCVVFPPICTAAACEDVAASAGSAGLTDEEIGLILAENDGYVLKLKSMELVGDFLNLFS